MNKNKLIKNKILIVGPAFDEWDLGRYMQRLLNEMGIENRTFPYVHYKTSREAGEQLLYEAKKNKPAVILGLKMDKIAPETIMELKDMGIYCVLWYTDCFEDKIPDWIKPLCREVDLFLTTAKGLVNEYARITCAPVYWVYEGAHLSSFPALRRLKQQKSAVYESQVAFVGNVFQPPVPDKALALRRAKLFKRIIRKYDLKIWGIQGLRRLHGWSIRDFPVIEWPSYNEELVKICASADIVLGINTVNSVELYFSNRTFFTLASGGFHLTHYVPGLENMFVNHKHLVWFHSDDECLDLIVYYLRHPLKRKRIAQAGKIWTRRRYNMRKQVQKILSYIDKHYEK